STYGWQRIAPWPKIIRLRVMMFAPSTVIAIGAPCQPRPIQFDGPRITPLPPCTSIASLATSRASSVAWYFAIAEGTAGFSPRAPHRRARGGGERVGCIGVAADPRERVLDAFEASDRHAELLADARVRTGREYRRAHAAGRIRRQRDRAADRKTFDQHAPALP